MKQANVEADGCVKPPGPSSAIVSLGTCKQACHHLGQTIVFATRTTKKPSCIFASCVVNRVSW